VFTARYGLHIYIYIYIIPRSAHTVYLVFCVDYRTNSDYFPIQTSLVFITEMECVYCTVRTGFVSTECSKRNANSGKCVFISTL
jgi:hypothetical protein